MTAHRVGDIVQCAPQGGVTWYRMVGKLGRLFEVAEIRRRADGEPAVWLHPRGSGSLHRVTRGAAQGRLEGQEPGFQRQLLEPAGDGSDYVPHALPPHYKGEPLPIAAAAHPSRGQQRPPVDPVRRMRAGHAAGKQSGKPLPSG